MPSQYHQSSPEIEGTKLPRGAQGPQLLHFLRTLFLGCCRGGHLHRKSRRKAIVIVTMMVVIIFIKTMTALLVNQENH